MYLAALQAVAMSAITHNISIQAAKRARAGTCTSSSLAAHLIIYIPSGGITMVK
jgi:hypothetical protein